MEQLKEIETNLLPKEDPSMQLRTAYQRLWKENEYRDDKKSRIHLFRIVLCSHRSLSYTALTEALRVSSEDGKVFEVQRNHLHVAKLHVTVMSRPEHPLYKASNIDSSTHASPRDISADSDLIISRLSRTNSALILDVWLGTVQRDRNGFLSYIASEGLYHFRLAATKASIFDAVWMEVIDKIFQRDNPACLLIAFAKHFKIGAHKTLDLFAYQGSVFEPPFA
jgi:hypothetical protein